MSYTERSDNFWEVESEMSEPLFYKPLPKTQREHGVAKLKELISTQDLALLDLHERERQLAAREAAAIRLEEHGRQQELAAREASLLGREAALAMKERELNLGEREQAVREAEVKLHEQEVHLTSELCKLKELENEFYKKSQEQSILLNEREREIYGKEENLRKKEQELAALSDHLYEKKKANEILLQTLKEKETSFDITLKEYEVLAENIKSRENSLIDRETQFFKNDKQAKISHDTVTKEFEFTKRSLEEKAIHLKALEDSIIVQEKELESKRFEIEQELDKHNVILKDTANIITEKERQFQNLEKETFDRIRVQENELKIWEYELQQQEIKIQNQQVILEQHNVEVIEKEKAVADQVEFLTQWQNQLQTRAKTLNEQAEAQEEHLRVILEKETIFDELKITLEQKEQQYKMLVNCKEHDFEVREQNLQKVISDLLHHDSKEDRMQCPNLKTFCNRNDPFIDKDSLSMISATKHNLKKSIYDSKQQSKQTNENVKIKSYKEKTDMTYLKSAYISDITSDIKNSHRSDFEKSCRQKQTNPAVASGQITQNNQLCLRAKVNKNLDDKFFQDEVASKSFLEDFTLTKKQIQLLEQIRSNKLNESAPLSQTSLNMIFNQKNDCNNSSRKVLQSSSSQPETTGKLLNCQSTQDKESYQAENIPERFRIVNSSLLDVPDKKRRNKSYSHTAQKQKSTSCGDLTNEIHLQLNQQNTLQGAVKCHRMELVRSLVERNGANVDERDSEGHTALHWAARLGHLPLVQYLGGEMGASVDAQNEMGQTALHLAALEGRLDAVQYLVNSLGADIEARDFSGETALHLAAGAGWLEVVKYISSVKGSRSSKIQVPKIGPVIYIEECP